MKIVIAIIAIVFLSCTQSTAATGCLSSNTTYTYLYKNGNYYSGAVGYYHRYESDRNITANNFCVTPVVPTVDCFINSTRSGFTSSPGTLVTYLTTNNCNLPLDGYEWALLFGTGLLSFILIRNKYVVI